MAKGEILRVEKIKKYYGDRPILHIPFLSFEEKRIYALVGPNGAGKTAFLNILSLLEEPSSGTIYFRGEKVHLLPPSQKIAVRRHITLVMQPPYLFQATVYQNIAYGLKLRGGKRRNFREKVREILSLVGMEDFENRNARNLSGGETQRVAIARALVVEPRVLLLDEPTTSIDRENAEIVEKLIRKIKDDFSTTVIFTTHNLEQAYRLGEVVIGLKEGKILEAPLT